MILTIYGVPFGDVERQNLSASTNILYDVFELSLTFWFFGLTSVTVNYYLPIFLPICFFITLFRYVILYSLQLFVFEIKFKQLPFLNVILVLTGFDTTSDRDVLQKAGKFQILQTNYLFLNTLQQLHT